MFDPLAERCSRHLGLALLTLAFASTGAHVAGCAHSAASTALTTPEAAEAEQEQERYSLCEDAAPPEPLPQESTPDPLRCSEDDTAPAPIAPPTTARGCRALPREERAPCLARVRVLSRAARPLQRARAAQATEDWARALTEYEAALHEMESGDQEDPGILGELAWARFLAREWCARTQDLDDLRYQADATGEERSPVAVLCLERTSLSDAYQTLEHALTLDTTNERRAALLYNMGRVSSALGQPALAVDQLRESLCLRDNATVREHYAGLLWRSGDAESDADPDAARSYYRQSLLVLADPERASFLAEIETARHAGFQLQAVSRSEVSIYPDLHRLCAQLLTPSPNEPFFVDRSNSTCAVSDWELIERPGEPTWSVGVLNLISPESNDGVVGASYVVARLSAGVTVLVELGSVHGDSRRENAYVGQVELSPLPDDARASLQVNWHAGEAYADGCDWDSSAFARLALCGWDGHRPRCFAEATLGPVTYGSESMLPTVQESLGRCDYETWVPPPQSPSSYGTLYDVDASSHELVITNQRDDGTTCVSQLEALCALDSRPITGCP